HSLGHARMQQGDDLAFGVEDDRARIAVVREVAALLVVVEDGDLPGVVPELVAMVRLQLRVASKGEVRCLPMLGNYEAGVTLFVHEVGVRQACGADKARNAEEMIRRVLKDGWVGRIGVEGRGDLLA